MAPDTLKILLLRWKPSLGVMGFGRDGKPSLSHSHLFIYSLPFDKHIMYMFILCIDDMHNNDLSICLLYAVVLPCVAAVRWMYASEG